MTSSRESPLLLCASLLNPVAAAKAGALLAIQSSSAFGDLPIPRRGGTPTG